MGSLSHDYGAHSSGAHTLEAKAAHHHKRNNVGKIQLVVMALAPLVLFLANAAVRHWLLEAFTTVCVVGGFIAAPILTLIAWIGVVLPPQALLHAISTPLFVLALCWLSLAVISAHVHYNKRQQL